MCMWWWTCDHYVTALHQLLNRWHVDFVRTFLETSTLPEDGFESYCNGRITQFSLRKQIVKFLLQHRSSEELWDPSCSHRDLFSEQLVCVGCLRWC